jgi:cell division protein FtsN
MAKKAQARRQGHSGAPAWAWLLAGLLVGALVFLGYRQYQVMMADAPQVNQPQAGASQSDNPDKNVEPPASGVEDGVLDTDYSFYDVLPTQETVAVEDETAGDADAADSTPGNSDATATNSANADSANPNMATASTAEPTNTSAAPAQTTEAGTSRYLLQAGAFERSADADDLKARIALSGEAARVETAEINGKTYYRVRLGPYNDAAAAERARANLAGQGIRADRIAVK